MRTRYRENIDYTSPGPEELQEKLRDKDFDFIKESRRGARDLFSLSARETRSFNDLVIKKFIKAGFALPNPSLFCHKSPFLWFLFIKAAPDKYFDIKDWIKGQAVHLGFSAYTSLGQYDFVLRMTADEALIRQVCDGLALLFGLTEDDKGADLPEIMRVRVTRPLCYSRVVNINLLPPLLGSLADKDRQAFGRFNESVDPCSVTDIDRERYAFLKEGGYLLGTRCLVNSPKLHSITAFILVDYNRLDDLDALLMSNRLKDSVIDLFLITGFNPYSALMVCEFEGHNTSAFYSYNRWMDNFYNEVSAQCLTFTSDSTIHEAPDVFESAASLRSIVTRHWTSERGVRLGSGVWFGKEENVPVYLDPQAFVYHAMIIGESGSGKSKSSIHLASELVAQGIQVIFISFKGGDSIAPEDIARCKGSQLDATTFCRDKSIHQRVEPAIFVLTDLHEEGRAVADHVLQMLTSFGSDGRQKPLTKIFFLDELFNITGEIKTIIEGKLIPALRTCREPGIGIVLLNQDFGDWDRVWGFCANKFIHRVSDFDATSQLSAQRFSSVAGIGQNFAAHLSSLPPGRMLCGAVSSEGQPLPPIVVQVPPPLSLELRPK